MAAFEKATAVERPDGTSGAAGETLPVWKSDDGGRTWQRLSAVPAPADLSDDRRYARYTSNWTNPFLYTLPERVGRLAAGTLLLASVVSGEDEWYREQKLADPDRVPDNDGDRKDVAIALFRSTDDGASWHFVNMIATGGWQGGSAGAPGRFSEANRGQQQDPLWEPHLMVYDHRLVAYYSDENDYTGVDRRTGVPTLARDNDTGPDAGTQVLVHRTWDGTSPRWSRTVIDVPGTRHVFKDGEYLGGGRPGMPTVSPTTDGRWLMTFEYWGGGTNVRYRAGRDPLRFRAAKARAVASPMPEPAPVTRATWPSKS